MADVLGTTDEAGAVSFTFPVTATAGATTLAVAFAGERGRRPGGR